VSPAGAQAGGAVSPAGPTVAITSAAGYVLASLYGGPLPGPGIIAAAGELSDGRVRLRAGTLYTLLDRLAAEGYVRRASRDSMAGRVCCRYALTGAGLGALQATALAVTEGLVPGHGRGIATIVSIGGRVRAGGK
jgi:DNA-binding PadR family transcriptional regulator